MARAVTTRNQNDRSYFASVNVDPGLPSLNQVCAKLLRSFGDKSSFGELLVVILDALAVVGALGLRPRGALLFADGNGSLITVACREIDTAALLKGFGNAPSISAAGIFLYQGLVILPLQDGEAHLGMVALGLDSGEQLDPSALALLGGLAPILSLVVCRRILESVVDFRDFEIQFAQTETLHQLAIAEQLRDLDTGLHVLRVAHYCKAIAEAAGLDDKTVSLILQAAPMHDVGKICIPDAILLSPRRLTEAEFSQVKRHTLFGEQILNGQGEVISAARIIAGSHHERWDGTGYPRGLSGSDIPFFGRICAIADTFDALGTHRPYKEPWKVDDILDYMRRQSGSQFDPELVDSFFVALPQILKFREVYADEMLVESPPTYLTPIQPADRKAFPWRGAYASGLHTIDVHHCYLFELTNNLSESLHSGGQIGEIAAAFKALEGYTKIHFREEERLMEACRYSALAEHRQEHARFIAMLDQSWEEMRRNPLLVGHKLLILKKWLVNHIMVPDRKAAAEWLHVRLALCPLGSVSAWLCVRLALCPAWLRVRLAPCPPPTRSAMT